MTYCIHPTCPWHSAMPFSRFTVAVILVFAFGTCPQLHAVESTDTLTLPVEIELLLKSNCSECHNQDVAEGNVDLSSLENIDVSERLEVLNKAQEQLQFGLMQPPESANLGPQQRTKVIDWLSYV